MVCSGLVQHIGEVSAENFPNFSGQAVVVSGVAGCHGTTVIGKTLRGSGTRHHLKNPLFSSPGLWNNVFQSRIKQSAHHGLQYLADPEGEDYEFPGDAISDAFVEATEDPDGTVAYGYPGRQGREGSGAYIHGGIDSQSGRLVGFMVPCVWT